MAQNVSVALLYPIPSVVGNSKDLLNIAPFCGAAEMYRPFRQTFWPPSRGVYINLLDETASSYGMSVY